MEELICSVMASKGCKLVFPGPREKQARVCVGGGKQIGIECKAGGGMGPLGQTQSLRWHLYVRVTSWMWTTG